MSLLTLSPGRAGSGVLVLGDLHDLPACQLDRRRRDAAHDHPAEEHHAELARTQSVGRQRRTLPVRVHMRTVRRVVVRVQRRFRFSEPRDWRRYRPPRSAVPLSAGPSWSGPQAPGRARSRERFADRARGHFRMITTSAIAAAAANAVTDSYRTPSHSAPRRLVVLQWRLPGHLDSYGTGRSERSRSRAASAAVGILVRMPLTSGL